MDIAKYLPPGVSDESENGFVDKRKYNGSKSGIAKARAAKKASKQVEEYEIVSESDESGEESDINVEVDDDEEVIKPKPKRAPKVKKPMKGKKTKSTIRDYQNAAAPYMINEELKQIKSIVSDLNIAKKKNKKPVAKKTVIQLGGQMQAQQQQAEQPAKREDVISAALRNRILLNF